MQNSDDIDIIRQLLATFRDEARSILTQLNRNLLLLEQAEVPDSLRSSSSGEVKRLLHTLKGNSATVGLDELEHLMHDVETSMKKSQNPNGFPPEKHLYAAWFESLDLAQELVEKEYDAAVHEKKLKKIQRRLAKLNASSPKSKEENADAVDIPKVDEPIEKSQQTDDEIIRVPTRRIDRLAEGIGELLAHRLQLEQQISDLKSQFQAMHSRHKIGERKRQEFASVLNRAYREGQIEKSANKQLLELCMEDENWARSQRRDSQNILSQAQQMFRDVRQTGISIRSLEEDLKRLRMTPVSELFQSFHRFVRDAAIKLEKDVAFITEGESVELDRNIIQQLREPLVHLLRNALDHGIEKAEQRAAAGKPPKGKLILRAFATGGGVVIEVEDDGAGMDTGGIRASAIEKGIITATEAESMTERGIQALAFRSGFSTMKEVSLMSGRGVGLDVVRNWVDRLRGRIDWESDAGKKTVIRMRLPLTMASLQALITRVKGQKFAIPLVAVDRVLSVKKDELRTIESRTVVMYQDQPIELFFLSNLLGMPSEDTAWPDVINVVISWGTENPRGWMVDELLGEQEIVLKNFSKYLKRIPNFVGAAIIGEGEVVLALNASDLHDRASSARATVNSVAFKKDEKAKVVKKVLVVDDSITTRTLEKLILLKAGYDVTEAKDGINALELMQNNNFDLVVTDVEMPKMNGFELTEKIRQTPALAHLPIVIISFMGREEDKLKGLQAGANAYMTKSQFSQSRLLNMIRQLIGE